MSKGLAQFKQRNSKRNAIRADLSAQVVAFNKNREFHQIYRRDLASGEVVAQTAMQFRFGLLKESGFERIKRVAPYSSDEQIAREALEAGARLFTDKGEYWVEKVLVAAAGQSFARAA